MYAWILISCSNKDTCASEQPVIAKEQKRSGRIVGSLELVSHIVIAIYAIW